MQRPKQRCARARAAAPRERHRICGGRLGKPPARPCTRNPPGCATNMRPAPAWAPSLNHRAAEAVSKQKTTGRPRSQQTRRVSSASTDESCQSGGHEGWIDLPPLAAFAPSSRGADPPRLRTYAAPKARFRVPHTFLASARAAMGKRRLGRGEPVPAQTPPFASSAMVLWAPPQPPTRWRTPRLSGFGPRLRRLRRRELGRMPARPPQPAGRRQQCQRSTAAVAGHRKKHATAMAATVRLCAVEP